MEDLKNYEQWIDTTGTYDREYDYTYAIEDLRQSKTYIDELYQHINSEPDAEELSDSYDGKTSFILIDGINICQSDVLPKLKECIENIKIYIKDEKIHKSIAELFYKYINEIDYGGVYDMMTLNIVSILILLDLFYNKFHLPLKIIVTLHSNLFEKFDNIHKLFIDAIKEHIPEIEYINEHAEIEYINEHATVKLHKYTGVNNIFIKDVRSSYKKNHLYILEVDQSNYPEENFRRKVKKEFDDYLLYYLLLKIASKVSKKMRDKKIRIFSHDNYKWVNDIDVYEKYRAGMKFQYTNSEFWVSMDTKAEDFIECQEPRLTREERRSISPVMTKSETKKKRNHVSASQRLSRPFKSRTHSKKSTRQIFRTVHNRPSSISPTSSSSTSPTFDLRNTMKSKDLRATLSKRHGGGKKNKKTKRIKKYKK